MNEDYFSLFKRSILKVDYGMTMSHDALFAARISLSQSVMNMKPELHRSRSAFRYVEVLDMYFGSVCELDIIFNFEKAYFILDELILAGEIQDTSKKSVLRQVELSDSYQEEELISLALRDVGLI